MSFDPMATAVDWLDAYRAGDIQAILEMYAEDAVVHCGCDELTNTGREGPPSLLGCCLRKHPAAELDDLQPSHGATVISYISGENVAFALRRAELTQTRVAAGGPA
ncbi:hypothetical protein ABH991_002910 [Bradyrhizobium ottawaense]|uniref:Nuclear transport factor 2 family protein n=1 Tax=Bradyrhizobium ottawaense TaxID=931866 RepID=A0ABV4FK87_9BRAD|nr:hypothetical protein SG09_26860 [Bradyrhizobium ottawaense]GMO10818.1 hypothetical protein BwSH12_77190 [Bradyrhizobium ottawaense]GMO11347.1 hypothetical protein BwSH20_77090 [Bradyrhizobium ottawaense]GMO39254.1 hypothetical protein BwSH14_49100 [Bradyrhizobium ottawaense]GMO49558.1 hypothetical protein BwSF21_69850 [Bradyrhizobium ottawaense]